MHDAPRDEREQTIAILDALLVAIDRRAEVVDVIFETDSHAEQVDAVRTLLGIGGVEARAVLDLQLRRLSRWERSTIQNELERLRSMR